MNREKVPIRPSSAPSDKLPRLISCPSVARRFHATSTTHISSVHKFTLQHTADSTWSMELESGIWKEFACDRPRRQGSDLRRRSRVLFVFPRIVVNGQRAEELCVPSCGALPMPGPSKPPRVSCADVHTTLLTPHRSRVRLRARYTLTRAPPHAADAADAAPPRALGSKARSQASPSTARSL